MIATLKTRVERESTDKVSWKKSSDMWRKRAEGGLTLHPGQPVEVRLSR